ncbi:DUF2071 domain-containing protein [Spirosoma luteolum]
MATTFLAAEWRNLIFANYPIDRSVLQPLVPYGTELDAADDGICYGSLVGFYFQRVRMLGVVPVPFHTEFEEFNLRFYVRRKTDDGWKRGVVFVKEIVPKSAIAIVANTLYGEPYVTHPMRHTWEQTPSELHIRYDWRVDGHWNNIWVRADPTGQPMAEGSHEAFITEHYWGYTGRGKRRTSEYEVVHPKWLMHRVSDYGVQCDVAKLYGDAFAPYFAGEPHSIFLTDGSPVTIKSGAPVH